MSWLDRLLPWRTRAAELEDAEQVRAWHRAGRPVSLSSWAELSSETRDSLEAIGCQHRLEELSELVGALEDPELLRAACAGAEALEDLAATRAADRHAEALGGRGGPRRPSFAGHGKLAEELRRQRDQAAADGKTLFGQPARVLEPHELGRDKAQETAGGGR